MSKIKQPNSRHCFICGLENPVGLHLHMYETEPGRGETQYIAPDHFQGYPGVLHGGIVAAIIDEISGRAHMGSDPNNPRFMFTGKLEVKYRKNVPIGKLLKIVGKVGKSKGQDRRSVGGNLRLPGMHINVPQETNELTCRGLRACTINVPQEQFDTSRLDRIGLESLPRPQRSRDFLLSHPCRLK
jgi:acyl-coenzyme A thioesterase PaaI-like protein